MLKNRERSDQGSLAGNENLSEVTRTEVSTQFEAVDHKHFGFSHVVFLLSMVLIFSWTFLLTSCGSTSFNANTSGSTSGGPSPQPSPSPTTTISILPNQSFTFSLTGNAGSNPKWTSGPLTLVDTLLKVRVKGLNTGYVNIPGYENYSVQASCYEYRIGVKNADDPDAVPVSITTPAIKPEGAGDECEVTASSEYVHDFSSAILGQTGPFELVVSNVRYDYYCQLYRDACSLPFSWECYSFGGVGYASWYCPMKNVYQNHLVEGTLDVQTN